MLTVKLLNKHYIRYLRFQVPLQSTIWQTYAIIFSLPFLDVRK